MRAISLPSAQAWAIIHAGLRLAPSRVAGDGPIILHSGGGRLSDDVALAVRALAPAGARPIPRGHLVGMARVHAGFIAAAWPLPHVRHLGAATPFVVDPAALGDHLAAYSAAWREMTLDERTTACPHCGDACGASCLLARSLTA